MSKNYATLRHDIWLPYRFAVGPVMNRFFEGLKEERIWGNRCPQCKKILVPARTFCPLCNEDMHEWVEVSSEGEVITWALSTRAFFGMPKPSPFIIALIHLDKTDCHFLHLIGGFDLNDMKLVSSKIKRGTRVKANWNKEKQGHMLDIEYFRPV
jgi:uncharacterized OB-fold protein